MEIKKCGIDDAEKLAALNRELIEDEKSGNSMTLPELCERMKSFLAGNYEAYFFFEGSELAGYALVDATQNPPYIRQFFIVRKMRHRGLGEKAFRILKKTLRADVLELDVLPWNERGMKFWQKMGFKEAHYRLRLEQGE